MIKVLFVCLGNICRSPTAEGMFTHLVKQEGLSDRFYIDSAGTGDHFAGSPPDFRSQAAARKRGIDISGLRARQILSADFTEFDYILAMDQQNYTVLRSLCPLEQQHKLHLFLDFTPELNTREVPDPYEGETDNFEPVLDLVEAGSIGLLAKIRQHRNSFNPLIKKG